LGVPSDPRFIENEPHSLWLSISFCVFLVHFSSSLALLMALLPIEVWGGIEGFSTLDQCLRMSTTNKTVAAAVRPRIDTELAHLEEVVTSLQIDS
jgi:hypothetical protein